MATSTPRLIFPLAAWEGGVTLIQGVRRDPQTGDYIISQARNVAGRDMQDLVLRRHRPDLSYVDSRTLTKAGHGNSIGIENEGNGTMIWVGNGSPAGTGRLSYNAGINSFRLYQALPNGDPTVFQNIICIRNGNRFRGYNLADAKAGTTTLLFDFTIPPWGKRFQGHAVISTKLAEGLVLVHRDVATKGASRAMAFTFTGKKVDEIDTTRMGDEAEGFLVEQTGDGQARAWIVKRTGAANRSRTVVATLWMGSLGTTSLAAPKVEPIASVLARYGRPTKMKLASLLKARSGKYVSRYTYYVQLWLNALGYYREVCDGKWGPYTQTAFDNFRRNIRPKWPASDYLGPPGITSLTLLRNATVKATGKDQMAVVK